jgi:hypothetical protein
MTAFAKRELAAGLRAIAQHEDTHWVSTDPMRRFIFQVLLN